MYEDILFSVIIPAYNAEKFIRETIQSVLDQSYSAFEVIVVDDGSEDATPQIAKGFKDERIEVYTLKHKGRPGPVRNYGISKSKGDYIAFLDADDLWLPQKLRTFYNFIKETNAQFMFSNGFIINENNQIQKKILPPHIRKNVLPPKNSLLLMTNFIPVSNVVISKTIIKNKPFVEDKRLRGMEDYRLWLQLNQEFNIYYIAETLFKYRVHPNMMSRNYYEQLERAYVIFEEIQKANFYSENLIELAYRITELKQLYARRQKLAILAKGVNLLWRSSFAEKIALVDYIKYLFDKWRKGAYIPSV